MDIVLLILAFFMMLIGLIGCIVPGLPGTPIAPPHLGRCGGDHLCARLCSTGLGNQTLWWYEMGSLGKYNRCFRRFVLRRNGCYLWSVGRSRYRRTDQR